MRSLFPSIALCSAIALIVPAATAKTFTPLVKTPQTYKDVQVDLAGLKHNMENVSCGGFNEEAMQAKTGDYFPIVNGVPGRKNKSPLGNLKTGVGVRDDFAYPTEGETGKAEDTEDNHGAWGFLTACDIHQEKVEVQTSVVPPASITVDINPFITDAGTGERYQLCLGSHRTPKECKQLYQFLRSQSTLNANVKDCAGLHVQFCFDDNEIIGLDIHTQECAGKACERPGPPTFFYVPSVCSVDADGNPVVIRGHVAAEKPGTFYRHYDTTVDATDEHFALRAECYDWYKEVDPKMKVTPASDDQCELVMTTETGGVLAAPNPEWTPADRQKGTYLPDADTVKTDPPAARTVADPWIADTETNLSILRVKPDAADPEKPSVEKIQERYPNPSDVSQFLATDLPVAQVASKTNRGARVDAFDDTGIGVEGSIARWWEAQQRQFAAMTRQPTLRLLLPGRFVASLDKSDPLLQSMRDAPSRSDGIVELTLHAGDDELGSVLAALHESFPLPVRERRITLIEPVLDTNEAQTRIAEWKLWQLQNPDRAAQADAIIKKIEGYRDAAESVRIFRTSLPLYLQRTMALQEQLRRFSSAWYSENANRLLGWAQVATQRQQLQKTWKAIGDGLLQAAECQLNWCSNQRYSLAIYSLLDNWLQRGSTGFDATTSASVLPDLRVPPFTPPPDRTIDLSWLAFTGGALTIPVFDPVLTRVKIPLPPEDIDAPLPDIPSYDSSGSAESAASSTGAPVDDWLKAIALPEIHFPAGISQDETTKVFTIDDRFLIPRAQAPDLDLAQEKAKKMEKILVGNDETVDDRTSLRGAYCRFSRSLLAEESKRDKKIVHVENDLKERVARLFARFAPNQKEDFAGRTARTSVFTADKTCAGDGVCAPRVGEIVSSWAWMWSVPAAIPKEFQTLYTNLRKAAIPPADKNPYYATPVDLMELLIPPAPQPDILLSPAR